MKNTFLTHAKQLLAIAAASLLFASGSLFAGDYSSLMAEAAAQSGIEARFPLWDKAFEAAKTDAEKVEVLRTAYETAKRIPLPAMTSKYARLLSNQKTLAQKERTSLYYESLKNMKQPKVSYVHGFGSEGDCTAEDWENFLAMPEKTPQQEVDALLSLGDIYYLLDDAQKCIEYFRKAIAHPSASVYDKSSATSRLARLYNMIGRGRESMAALEELVKLPLPNERKAEAYIIYGDSILQGCGYYFEPAEDDYKAAYKAYENAMALKGIKPDTYFSALLKKNQSLFDRKKYSEALRMAQGALADKKFRPNRVAWNDLMTITGNAKMALKDYPGAIEAFEQVVKINARTNHGDSQRWLGHAYYKNGDYALAIAMYDYALEALKGAEDDRPAWCEGWIKRLQWYTNPANSAQLDNAMKKRREKLLAQSKELGARTSSAKSSADGVNPM